MHKALDEEELPPVERSPDTELTLGPMMMLGLFFGLMLLCGLCFGVGYSMGSRSAHNSSATGQQPGAPASSPATTSHSKPAAIPQEISRARHSAIASGSSSSATGANSAQPTVKPPVPAAATTPAQPAPAGTLMIQVAIVPHQEDADILINALRKHGYTATARRDPVDNQLHVRIGPFSNRNDAEAMRKKLIYDGYNAIVQP